jgi:Mrp family chromosome partitioning ATPase
MSAVEMPGRAFRSVGVCLPNFHVLAIDPTTPNLNGLVGIGFEIAIRQLCLTRYRYIIVDGPPVIGSADCSVIADSMDGVVLCAARGYTKLNAYRDAAKSLHPVPVLAKVLLDKPGT